jgi:hypothetical protein
VLHVVAYKYVFFIGFGIFLSSNFISGSKLVSSMRNLIPKTLQAVPTFLVRQIMIEFVSDQVRIDFVKDQIIIQPLSDQIIIEFVLDPS